MNNIFLFPNQILFLILFCLKEKKKIQKLNASIVQAKLEILCIRCVINVRQINFLFRKKFEIREKSDFTNRFSIKSQRAGGVSATTVNLFFSILISFRWINLRSLNGKNLLLDQEWFS